MIPHRALITYTPHQQQVLQALSDQVEDLNKSFSVDLNDRYEFKSRLKYNPTTWSQDSLAFKDTCCLDLWEKIQKPSVICQVDLGTDSLKFRTMGGNEMTDQELEELEETGKIMYVLPDQRLRYRFEFCDATNRRLSDTFKKEIAQRAQQEAQV